MRNLCLAFTLSAMIAPASAQGQPPIKSAQDAACRDEAQSRVFGAPNPRGLSMYDLGAQLYQECMRRSQAGSSGSRRSRQTQ